jgi:hypothetical protein
MRLVRNAWMIQIDITTRCHLSCAHCTRGLRHLPKREDASLEFIESALRSLAGWPGAVGCIGGEPTLHRRFPEVCALYKRYFPRWKCGLWTAGGPRFEQHRHLIDDTFQIINYNDHSVPARHQPLLVAGKDVMPDEKKRNRCIERCWLQHEWAPAITEHGAYFCETAAGLDHVLGGKKGWAVTPDWWKRKSVGEQRELCNSCGIPYRMAGELDTVKAEVISPSMEPLLRERNSPAVKRGNFRILTEEEYERSRASARTWEPEKYVKRGKNYWTRRSWRMHARQKLMSIPYRIRKTFWGLTDRIESYLDRKPPA